MTKNLRLLGPGRIALATLVSLLIATSAYSAPSEENISGSTPVRTVPRSSLAQRSSARARVQPDTEAPDEPADTPAESLPEVVSAPRAAFPYAVRAGDTPASIASLFGVPLADLMRANHLREDSELRIAQTLRVPNPFLARERELSTEIDRLSAEKQAAEQRAQTAEGSVSALRSQIQDLNTSNSQYGHDLRMLPWWRTAMFCAAAIAALMFGIMMVALVQWWMLRSRFQAVAEMNESLRRLDIKYKAAVAKAELRLQELYGRRRRGIPDGQERPKIAEEAEIEQLNRRLAEVLEHYLRRLDRPTAKAGRARWRERLAGVGSPVEARSVRR
jgi:LysM repeat protein